MVTAQERISRKRLLILFTGALAALLAVIAAVAFSSRAGAAPLMPPPRPAAPGPQSTAPATVPVPSASPTRQVTVQPTGSVPPATGTPQRTPTAPGPVPTGVVSPTPCVMSFSDVQPADWYYAYVHYMYCSGVVQGYPDGTFRPGNLATRGQIMKIVIGASGLAIRTQGGPHFADVAPDHTFYQWVESAYAYGVVQGYPCGGPGEPCGPGNKPYFRPGANVTRGQLTKIIVLAAQTLDPVGWPLLNPPVATFNDVARGSTFYGYIETAVAHAVLEGYSCGGEGEPCPGRYFRPGGFATRAQLSKMVFLALAP